MNATTIVDLKTVTLDRTGTQVLRTRKGERRYGVAWVLADGSLLISRISVVSVTQVTPLLLAKRRGLREGWINADTAKWDEHEQAMYFKTRRTGLV
jgi:hypothetical protein